VANFHHQAGLIDIKQVVSPSIDDYEFLLPIAHRIRDLVILGGEPFYDKNCLKFLHWASHNLTSRITLFTNGSAVDWDWVDQYPGKIVMVFSIDAVGKHAEYIRFGTDWTIVEQNLQRAQDHPSVELRVNITQTVYNYYYISDIIDFLIPRWPSVVSFGLPQESHFQEHVVPIKYRKEIISKLVKSVKKIQQADIETGQKSHAINALNSLITNFQSHAWNLDAYNTFKKFVNSMDRVKHINIRDYCEFVADMLSEQPVEIL
jgi:sulfatase maturation enzyme AslB (radical SAM superfamily)